MTEQELAEIEARTSEASGTRWHVDETGYCVVDSFNNVPAEVAFKPDATFIAHARQDIPALVADVRRLQAHRFVEVAEQIGERVAAVRGKQGRDTIRSLHKEIGPLLDELDAAYARWLKGEPGGRL